VSRSNILFIRISKIRKSVSLTLHFLTFRIKECCETHKMAKHNQLLQRTANLSSNTDLLTVARSVLVIINKLIS